MVFQEGSDIMQEIMKWVQRRQERMDERGSSFERIDSLVCTARTRLSRSNKRFFISSSSYYRIISHIKILLHNKNPSSSHKKLVWTLPFQDVEKGEEVELLNWFSEEYTRYSYYLLYISIEGFFGEGGNCELNSPEGKCPTALTEKCLIGTDLTSKEFRGDERDLNDSIKWEEEMKSRA